MTPQRWYVIATMMMLVFVSSSVGANKVLNGDFEAAGDDTCDVPDWTDDHADEGRICKTHRVPLLGADESAGLLVVGPEVRRVSQLFSVFPGNADLPPENLTFEFDAQVLLGGSVAVLELVGADGTLKCGAKIQLKRVNNVLPEAGFSHYAFDANSATPEIDPIVVCPGAVKGRVVLGGSYVIDPLAVISAPIGATIFDNIEVKTAP